MTCFLHNVIHDLSGGVSIKIVPYNMHSYSVRVDTYILRFTPGLIIAKMLGNNSLLYFMELTLPLSIITKAYIIVPLYEGVGVLASYI